jgi:hypothetical protein
LGRDYIETGRYTDEVFPSLGVRFIALMDNIDSEGNDDLLPFRSILNDYHLKDLSRKVKSVLKAKAETGELVGKAPFGYIKDPNRKNHLLVDDYSANVVRRIFSMRAEGIGCAKIAATLNKEGIPSPYTYRNMLAGTGKPSRAWITCTVYDMLANETYIGNCVRFKTGYLSYKSRIVIDKPKAEWIRVEGAFPQIIDLAVWEAVRKVAGSTVKTTTSPFRDNLFTKLLRCAECDDAMVHKKGYSKSRITGETKHCHSYICGKHHRTGGSECTRHTIRENVLLSIVRDDISRQLASVNFDEGQLAGEVQRIFNKEALAEAKSQHNQLSARIEELDAVGVSLYEDRLKGIINIDTFKLLSEKAETEKSEIMAEYKRLSDVIAAEESRISEICNLIPKLQEFLTLENVTREILSSLIDHIIVSESEGRSQNRIHDVQIFYRFGKLSDLCCSWHWKADAPFHERCLIQRELRARQPPFLR